MRLYFYYNIWTNKLDIKNYFYNNKKGKFLGLDGGLSKHNAATPSLTDEDPSSKLTFYICLNG